MSVKPSKSYDLEGFLFNDPPNHSNKTNAVVSYPVSLFIFVKGSPERL